MPKPQDYIWKQIRKYDVDDKIRHMQSVEEVADDVRDFTIDIIDGFRHNDKAPSKSLIPQNPTPNLAESAFIERKNITTLYNVTNKEDKIETKEISTKHSWSIKVRDFDLFTNIKNKSKSYGLILGEHCGVKLEHNKPFSKTTITATYNVSNKKREITYKNKSVTETYKTSIYQKDNNIGFTTKYSNSNGFNSAFSVDKQSAAADFGYSTQINQYNKLDIGAFATIGKNDSRPFVGIDMSLTL